MTATTIERPDAAPADGPAPLPRLGSLDDGALMERLRAGDGAAFEVMYDRHSRAVYGLARRILQDSAAADDVTQDAFLAMWRRRDAYAPGRGTPRTWILGIAHHRAIDTIRRRRSHLLEPLGADHDECEAPDRTEAEAIRRDEATTIGNALRCLPNSQRRVLDLAYFAGLTQSEIATQLEVPLGTVKSRIRLALDKLAHQFEAVPSTTR